MSRHRLLLVPIMVAVMCAGMGIVGVILRSGLDAETGLDGDGGTIAWTLDTANGSRDAWIFGDTAVVLDGTSLLGLRATDGTRVWQLPYADEDAALTAAGGMAVVRAGKNGPVDVIEPATGRVAWSAPAPVRLTARDDALYLDTCETPAPGCTAVKRRVTDGETLWTVTDPPFTIGDAVIGARRPQAPPASASLPVTTAGGEGALLDTATGTLLPGRIDGRGWYLFAAGDTLVSTDHDPPSGDRDCTITVAAVNARTGTPAWNGPIYGGRDAAGECRRSFPTLYSGSSELFGAGSDVAAVTRSGRPTLIDVTTGAPRWTSDAQGSPIAGDDRTLLVRENAETGPIALLGLADGRTRWTAPDTGLPTSSASWEAVVAGDLVAVMGATGDRPYVLVYDATTGTQLARRGGWLTGIGDGWAMVSTGAGADPGRLTLHLLTF
ncbi:outer membrane protein assembly factor BamB family protein [Catenuloplanes japonicus]|uniref:outer membrane protein assembly factor BamB family protein n=1 Tax=Catenuloplanes japonicus TaxID=33876 RepID=UPI000525D539|nr:PQQ-binding-like beta-propeller repeat protein [Catenuloplanes japonicus]